MHKKHQTKHRLRGVMIFEDRVEAGKTLAEDISEYNGKDAVVFALPRGGVVVGAEVARQLGLPLELVIPRKIGHPAWQEYAIGALTETGEPVWNDAELQMADESWIQEEVERQRLEAKHRRISYLGKERYAPDARGKIAIVVDDGIATGLTLRAALKEVRRYEPRKIVVAVPVAPRDAIRDVARLADEVVVAYVPASGFGAVGAYYRRFPQVEDDEVKRLVREYSKAASR